MIDLRDDKFFVDIYELENSGGSSIKSNAPYISYEFFDKGQASAAGSQRLTFNGNNESDLCGTSSHMYQLTNCSFKDTIKPSYGTSIFTPLKILLLCLPHGFESGFSPTGDNNHNS